MNNLRRLDTAAWIGVALGFATFLISIGLAIKQYGANDPTWKWSVVLAFIGATGTVVSAVQGLNSAAQVAAIENRFVTRSEMLTPDRQKRLLERLNELPARSVDLTVDAQDRESADFGSLLSEIFHVSGCLREHITVHIAGPSSVKGLWIMHPGQQPGPVVQKLHDALVESGLPDVRYAVSQPLTEGHFATLSVLRLR